MIRVVFYDPTTGKEIPIRRLKIGRNEPCHCGSGKKYKKCCGNPAKREKNIKRR